MLSIEIATSIGTAQMVSLLRSSVTIPIRMSSAKAADISKSTTAPCSVACLYHDAPSTATERGQGGGTTERLSPCAVASYET